MAFNKDGLKKIAVGGTLAGTYPSSGGTRNIWHYITNDLSSEVLANAYFDDVPDDPLQVGDFILGTIDADGTPLAKIYMVTVGGGDVTVVALVST